MRAVRTDEVYAAIAERIVNQALPPGGRVNIDALARELGVSPTPVREALGRLAAERFVKALPYKGYAVAPLPTLRQFTDMMGVRRLIETEGARLAAERATVPHHQALRDEVDTAAAAVADGTIDPPRWRAHNRAFHDLVMRAAGNEVLYEVWQSLRAPILLARLHHGHEEVDYPVALAEHRAIGDAIRARDAAAAMAATLVHVNAAEERMARKYGRDDL